MNDDRKQEFILDAKVQKLREIIKDGDNEAAVYQAQSELPHVTRQLRSTQKALYGWRFVEELYGDKKDRILQALDRLRRRVLNLENEQIRLQNLVDNYDFNVNNQKKIIAELQSRLSSDIGEKPSPEKIIAANEKLLRLHREAGSAEMNLPRVQKELAEAKVELEKLITSWEKAKKHTSDEHYESPGHEVDARTKAYMDDHNVSYSTAMGRVLKSDLVLSFAYMSKN